MAANKRPTTREAHPGDPSPRRGPRPRGTVRSALVEAGVALARAGGPDAVVLREATRMVGVVPNAAYRHFADRDALLAEVSQAALKQLAQRMADAMNEVRARSRVVRARLRLAAVGRAYLDFARTEPGLFDTAFAATEHATPVPGSGDEALPLHHLNVALDGLVEAGLLEPGRRLHIEYPVWATVHGLAELVRGPLRSLSDGEKSRLEARTREFITAALSQER